MRLNFLCTKTTKQRVHLSSCKLMISPPVERCFWEVIELTNQVTFGTLCVPWRTVTSNATLPVCSDNSQCEMHRTRKVPTPADRAEARPDSLSLDPSHFTFIVCLTGFDRPRPKLSCLWPSLSSSYLRVHQQKHKNNRAWVSSAFPQSTGWCLCAGRFGQHTHIQNCLPPMPVCADINVCVKSCITRRPITASFTRQVTGRKTESVTEEIRWKKERKKKQLVQSETVTVWPFADAKGTLSGGSRGQALCWGQTVSQKQCQAVRITLYSIFPLQRERKRGWEMTPMQGSRPNTNKILNALLFSNNANMKKGSLSKSQGLKEICKFSISNVYSWSARLMIRYISGLSRDCCW